MWIEFVELLQFDGGRGKRQRRGNDPERHRRRELPAQPCPLCGRAYDTGPTLEKAYASLTTDLGRSSGARCT